MAFPNNCNPRVINVDPSTGCSLTRANILGMTPQMFEDQGFKEVGMDRLIARAKEARVAGAVENTLETLLMSRLANIKSAVAQQNIGGSDSVILPYIYRRQKRNINTNYWAVTAGAANAQAGANGNHAGLYDLTIQQPGSMLYVAQLDPSQLAKYFLPGKHVLVEWVGTDKTSYSSVMKIVSAATTGAGPYVTKVTVEPNVSSAAFAGYDAAHKLPYQPKNGVAVVLANNVSDYESWCYQDPAENTNKLLTYWLQTSRETFEYNDEYLKALNAALTSNYFKEFRQLPLAEQKRIQHSRYVRDWLNSVFYGQVINEHQTVEDYRNLPQVVDPANTNCTFEYKSNALGFKTQLASCGRVYDKQGAALDLDSLCAMLYDVKRSREASGGSVDTIDLMTDRFTAGRILEVMTKFYKDKYGVTSQRYWQGDVPLKFEDQIVWQYNVYQLPPDLGGLNMAVFTHPYFDDKLAAFGANTNGAGGTVDANVTNRGRTIWGIDWSDILIGIAGTNSATRQTNIADKLYYCVIKPNITRYQLNSTTWTTIIEDPNRHFVIDNFSDACPTITATTCAA